MVHLGNHFPPYQKLLETRNDYRRIVLREKNVLEIPKFKGNRGILLFTWVDRRNFTLQGEYRDPHFGPLPVELKKRGYEILFVPRVLYTIPYREAVDRLLNTRENFLFPEQCISTSDISSCQRRSNAFKPDIPEDITVGSVPVLSLAKEQIENYRTTLAENLVYEYLIKYLAECGILPSQIIHTCEGHSWEQVMTGAVRKYLPKTKAIGYDNVTFSRLVLSMYPAESELHIRPIPDRIVTNGPLFYEVLRKEGLPPDRIAKGCALRHTYLWDSSDPDSICRSKKTGPNRILVATSIGLGDSVELASKAALAFGGNSDYEILVKCHPMVDVNRVKTYLGSHTDFQNLAFVSESIDRLLPCADILLYTYTSICFEALRFGVFPICVRSENFLNLDPLDAAPSVRRVATTPEEIRKEVEGCIGMSAEERLNYENQAKGILKAALAPVTPSCIDSFILEEG
jgi:hypothetical protein